MITRSHAIAESVSAVSASDSPLTVAEVDAEKFSPSAERRLAAISKLVLVRVLGSRKRLTIVRPRSVGSFLMRRWLTSLNESAVSRIRVTSSGVRSWMSMMWREDNTYASPPSTRSRISAASRPSMLFR